MDFMPNEMKWKEAYKVMIGSILPRPIAFVSSMNKDGIANLAPFSFFTAISADPMMVCFSPMRNGEDGSKKDTLINIEETGEFVINIVSESFSEKMNHCAINYLPEEDEFIKAGLTKSSSRSVQPPRVKESLIHMECIKNQILHFGDHPGAGSLVIGEVITIQIDDSLLNEGRINAQELKPIGRLAGQLYTRPMTDTFELIRQKIDKR
ncbi:flavin reductase family protein [Jeotgalibacillus sp. ET6]|uniref:flavin reductase family protein n=1 Tax=Jeotgalibacillus sp. ET6 TaxID=3037260 RepID=UPI0024184009|nr:flavin reductase family protein [Jeotgalibacillus sp. ET6]MDG5473054.1 flavin reductase family protein [Jeotgalibacillus sp. ET6]